ncbi:MAG TPA: hypothetical protein VM290_04290 [Gaiellaceae bacterium]|nr:hypothetical protein [Gaiellaceae bacterium]
MTEAARAALRRAKARLDTLALYPEPVRIDGVRVRVVPWLFRLPVARRFQGLASRRTIYLRHPPGAGASDDLVTHELVHVWQAQHRWLALNLSYLRWGYRRNPFEREAREAVAATRDAARR